MDPVFSQHYYIFVAQVDGLKEELDPGIRGHLFEQLESHLLEMHKDGSHDLSSLKAKWEAFRGRVYKGNFSHNELDDVIQDIQKASLE